jgi:hypothetical protein
MKDRKFPFVRLANNGHLFLYVKGNGIPLHVADYKDGNIILFYTDRQKYTYPGISMPCGKGEAEQFALQWMATATHNIKNQLALF